MNGNLDYLTPSDTYYMIGQFAIIFGPLVHWLTSPSIDCKCTPSEAILASGVTLLSTLGKGDMSWCPPVKNNRNMRGNRYKRR